MPAYGDLVIIVTPKGKRSLRRVDENQDMHTQDGILRMADVVEAPFGSEVCTTLGVPYRIQKPTLNDIVKGVKRQTKILYNKDIGLTTPRGSGISVCVSAWGRTARSSKRAPDRAA